MLLQVPVRLDDISRLARLTGLPVVVPAPRALVEVADAVGDVHVAPGVPALPQPCGVAENIDRISLAVVDRALGLVFTRN